MTAEKNASLLEQLSHFDETGLSLCAFDAPDGEKPRAGIVRGTQVYDLVRAIEATTPSIADTDGYTRWTSDPSALELLLAIDGWADLVDQANAELPKDGVPSYAIDTVTFRSPVRRPEKIIALALNYVSHGKEANRELPEHPSIFGKYANALTGATDDVMIPHASHRIDYEGELAVIIGATATEIEPDQVDAIIAGYAVANDVSARDYQVRTTQIMQGKIFDAFCPLGPVLRRLPTGRDLADLQLRTWVNEDLRQDAKLGDMIFDVRFVVAYLSRIMTLRPGDVILTGTPGGIGGAMSPRRWLRDGDTVTITIDEIGTIRNRFVAAE